MSNKKGAVYHIWDRINCGEQRIRGGKSKDIAIKHGIKDPSSVNQWGKPDMLSTLHNKYLAEYGERWRPDNDPRKKTEIEVDKQIAENTNKIVLAEEIRLSKRNKELEKENKQQKRTIDLLHREIDDLEKKVEKGFYDAD